MDLQPQQPHCLQYRDQILKRLVAINFHQKGVCQHRNAPRRSDQRNGLGAALPFQPAVASPRLIKSFPIDESYRVKAKFIPYNPTRMISVPNILGETSEEPSPGYVEFTLRGHRCHLVPVTEDNQLFFIFKDLTSGKETYPPGRFLYADMPKDGEVILDFNKAYNPPCAFTPYATCPLPPAENRLPIRIEAGEWRYGH